MRPLGRVQGMGASGERVRNKAGTAFGSQNEYLDTILWVIGSLRRPEAGHLRWKCGRKELPIPRPFSFFPSFLLGRGLLITTSAGQNLGRYYKHGGYAVGCGVY